MRSDVTVVLDLAAEQEGLLTTQQAHRRGVTRLVLSRLAEASVIERVAHGVYATPEGSMHRQAGLRAAWLALDPHQFSFERLGDGPAGFSVTHRSAAELHGLGQLIPERFEFVSRTRKRTRREDVRLRRRSISEDDITVVDGLPCTTVERTVADLVDANEDLSLVAEVLGDAEFSVIDFERLARLLEPLAARNGHESGAALLQSLMVDGDAEAKAIAPIFQEAFAPLMRSLRPQLAEMVLDREANARFRAIVKDLVQNSDLQRVMREAVQPSLKPALVQLQRMRPEVNDTFQQIQKTVRKSISGSRPPLAPSMKLRSGNDPEEETGLTERMTDG